MKTKENVECKVKPSYLINKDREFIEKFSPDLTKDIFININLSKLRRIDDLYKDKTTFYKSMRKGIGSASPYIDCFIWCNNIS